MPALTLSEAPVAAMRGAAAAERRVYAKIVRRLLPILTRSDVLNDLVATTSRVPRCG